MGAQHQALRLSRDLSLPLCHRERRHFRDHVRRPDRHVRHGLRSLGGHDRLRLGEDTIAIGADIFGGGDHPHVVVAVPERRVV
eukprot:2798289-Prymnesium_polylepis.1